jgi:hypothetical protein
MATVHPIIKYTERLEMSLSEFASVLGYSHQHISKMTRDSTYRPGPSLAEAIVRKTGGEISFNDLYSWQPRRGRK